MPVTYPQTLLRTLINMSESQALDYIHRHVSPSDAIRVWALYNRAQDFKREARATSGLKLEAPPPLFVQPGEQIVTPFPAARIQPSSR